MGLLTQAAPPEPAAPPVRVGDLLVARGDITPEQLNAALSSQKDTGHKRLLGETIVEMGFATEEQVLEALADNYGVPFARITPKLVDPRVIELLPRDFLDKHCALPMFLIQGRLTVAVHEPSNVFLIEEIERQTGHKVQVVASSAHDIRAMLDRAGLHDVKIGRAHGFLSDHYNPATRSLALSQAVHDTRSIAAVGVATHEAGHAIQHAKNYGPLQLRSLLVPTANIGSSMGYIVMVGGLFLASQGIFMVGVV